jgi:hypothetical protein
MKYYLVAILVTAFASSACKRTSLPQTESVASASSLNTSPGSSAPAEATAMSTATGAAPVSAATLVAMVQAFETFADQIEAADTCPNALARYEAGKAKPAIATPEASRAIDANQELASRRRKAAERIITKTEGCTALTKKTMPK